MQLRILGETELKQKVICPMCRKIARDAGDVVEILADDSTQEQFANITCKHCKETNLIN